MSDCGDAVILRDAFRFESAKPLAPVLLGDGVRFFDWPDAPDTVSLETIDVERSGQITNPRFYVVK